MVFLKGQLEDVSFSVNAVTVQVLQLLILFEVCLELQVASSGETSFALHSLTQKINYCHCCHHLDGQFARSGFVTNSLCVTLLLQCSTWTAAEPMCVCFSFMWTIEWFNVSFNQLLTILFFPLLQHAMLSKFPRNKFFTAFFS